VRPIILRLLITPGGIATSGRAAGRRWRTRPVCSSPLEGSQRAEVDVRCGVEAVCSSPLEGSQHAHTPHGGHGCLVCSSPLEGSQRVRLADLLQSAFASAHHPWRDRNLCPSRGGAAPRPSARPSAHHPWRDRNGAVDHAVQRIQVRSAHHPWRDRNCRSIRSLIQPSGSLLITPGGIATWPRSAGHGPRWRLLITPGGIATSSPSTHTDEAECLLITPGGIATPSCPGTPGRARTSAHHPWRDRNLAAVHRVGADGRVCSSPLEGSQQGEQTGVGFDGEVCSSPLEGSQRYTPLQSWGRPGVCSSPLEGSQPHTTASTSPGTCLLITPGGIATLRR